MTLGPHRPHALEWVWSEWSCRPIYYHTRFLTYVLKTCSKNPLLDTRPSLSMQQMQLFSNCSTTHWPERETFVIPSKRRLFVPRQRFCSAGKRLPWWVFWIESKRWIRITVECHLSTRRVTSVPCTFRQVMSEATPLCPQLMEDPLQQGSHRRLVPISL